MTEFTYYDVTYTYGDSPSEYRMQCMTVEGETTTDDFAAMIGARIAGSGQAGKEMVTVTSFKERHEGSD